MKCKYCQQEMSYVGPTLCDQANGWHCDRCNHEEVGAGSYILAGRPTYDRVCKCTNCFPEMSDAGARDKQMQKFVYDWDDGSLSPGELLDKTIKLYEPTIWENDK